ncbi:hypothetical protein DNHGIG_04790 [Collibacillus ludicampi]|jgi:hypothetical protein|uniref:DDE Tnp4 domain-containing protein n=1 Tax=Collibacillus ludicampi TaxID=2771369 RepID=A0AAV4LAV8_9BACL|nr:hypothetical protein [Collibacillus ludicampi]GIM44930.1 hypothetical protein DNHGIG_04790 [Collibacillus ludicampi]
MRYYETLKVLDPQELQLFNVKDQPTVSTETPSQEHTNVIHSKEKTILLDNRFSYLRERMALRKKKRHRINAFANIVRNALHI